MNGGCVSVIFPGFSSLRLESPLPWDWEFSASTQTTRFWVLIPLIGSLIYQGRRIYVYTKFAPKQALDSEKPRSENLLSLFIANVYMYNRNATGLLDLIYATSPDMVLLTEPDHWWENHLKDLLLPL